VTAEQTRRFSDQLARLDEEIYRAEVQGNLSERVSLLRERAGVWTALAEVLARSGRDDVAARLAALRDQVNADRLAIGGWSR
jgi:septal ring factor EnvC (AmiA/AmiB activator)